MKKLIYYFIIAISFNYSFSQDYFLENFGPFNESIQSPEEFLGYEIGDQHTRHDLILAYFKYLSSVSERANLINYGKSYEGRTLTLLSISSEENLKNLEEIKTEHLKSTIPGSIKTINENLPVIINLGYGIHGNEPSGSEAALLTAYTLIASKNKKIDRLTNDSVVFIDPTLNPDGRDRHSQWANQYKSINLVADSNDVEHNESWPRGRTNHYWFDLNRDFLLAIHPEIRGKLNWFHEWYPNVVLDVHEMGTNSNYFFDPMKSSASVKPLIPQENVDLYPIFAEYYVKYMDSIGSFYYSKESFDETYPGYGSTYSDLQGGLALLFEQASSRGHVQETNYGEMTFGFTIRNQFLNGIATVEAAVDNKILLRDYQKRFFESALEEFKNEKIKAYEFGDIHDKNRTKAFIDKLLIHKIKVYKNKDKFIVPVNQLQSRMVKNFFETHDKYLDSVFYDASAWSVSNFYNMKHKAVRSIDVNKLTRVNDLLVNNSKVSKSNYAYILDWDDYNTPGALNHLHKNGVISYSAYKPFSIKVNEDDYVKSFNRGTVMVPVSKQKVDSEKLFQVVKSTQEKFNLPVFSTETGYSSAGIDLGSNFFRINKKVKVAMLIGDGVSSYESGEVWHLLDTRVHIPLTKIRLNQFNRASLDKYTTLVMVSGTYNQISDLGIKKIKDWVGRGNTLITIGSASSWAIKKEIVNESLVETKNDTIFARKRYIDAREYSGRERIGGSILKVDLDLTHPLAFGYRDQSIPVYKNNNVFLNKSKSHYSSVAIYSKNPHIDGYVSKKNMENNLKGAASLIVSDSGFGRVVLFADNPNFRGTWYGTNKLFLNAIFFGANISVPK
ncbi:M14 family zinc carboxypeptidase [Flavobacteriales bacterium]|nr:M14 family zinc carboxypeptidase [Flavobacteriales bacterium]